MSSVVFELQQAVHGPPESEVRGAGPAAPSEPVHMARDVGRATGLAWTAYHEHFAAVWRTLRRLGVGEGDVEDALQDVFLTVQRRAHEFRGDSQLKTWVLGIAVRVALSARRGAQKRRLRFCELPEEPPCTSAAPDELAAEREAVEVVHTLLGKLAPEQRVLLVLVDLEQLTVIEAAQLLGLIPSTAYKRLDAARSRFSAELERLQSREQWRSR
jgi:RNA polymerase sigma-70 factor, ECF subfamily